MAKKKAAKTVVKKVVKKAAPKAKAVSAVKPKVAKVAKKVTTKTVKKATTKTLGKTSGKTLAKPASRSEVKSAVKSEVAKAAVTKAVEAPQAVVAKTVAPVAAVVPVAAAVPGVVIGSSGKIPAVGSKAPNFSLPSSVGKIISLSDYAKKTVVLYFYPRADTPGCTVQACGFRDAIASYGKLSVDVLGISPDSVALVTSFGKKFNLNFPLLADAAHKISDMYGTWVEKSMYGKTYWGTARTTFIIKNGLVAAVMEKVKPAGHEAEVLSVLENL